MKAFDFVYDNRNLSDFGCILCKFDSSNGVEIVSDGAEITFNTVSVLDGSKHHLVSSQYEDCLEATLQICKYSCNGGIQEITSIEHRELTKWLNRKKFLKFKILDENNMDLYHEASFNISKIEMNGKLYGLELAVKTNRPFALKEPRTIVFQSKYIYTWEKFYVLNGKDKGESTGQYVTSHNRNAYPDDGVSDNDIFKNNYYYVYIEDKKIFDNKFSINDTSYEEGYIYPITEITIAEDGDLDIYNALENRHTIIKGCKSGEIIIMDYPVIQSSISSHNIQNDFNWVFFRVANTYDNSKNDLTFSLPCSIKIKYSPIVKVGL